MFYQQCQLIHSACPHEFRGWATGTYREAQRQYRITRNDGRLIDRDAPFFDKQSKEGRHSRSEEVVHEVVEGHVQEDGDAP